MRQNFIRLLFFCLVSLALSRDCLANSWRLYNLGTGLPGMRVTAFATFNDVMAVGTNNGVALNDGETCVWRTFPLPPQIASATINDLAFDDEGHLWIATPNGLGHVQQDSVEVFGPADGLPSQDVERILIVGKEIIVGSFGGFLSKAFIPSGGRTTFIPVNYGSKGSSEALNLKTVGVSRLVFQNSSQGLMSTRGNGITRLQGLSQITLDKSENLISDWVEDFTLFSGPGSLEHLVIATSKGLSLVQNWKSIANPKIPGITDPWLTGIALQERVQDIPFIDSLSPEEKILAGFLGGRTLWIGTKDNGLFRFQDGAWTKYDPGNSRLPSKKINRLFIIGERLIICTDAGLVIISMYSHAHDEYKAFGFGLQNFKSFFPMDVTSPVRKIAHKRHIWASTERGLSNLRNPAHETFSSYNGTMYSNKITQMVFDNSGFLWIIFDEKFLCRLWTRDILQSIKPYGKSVKEGFFWDFIKDDAPWPGDTKLTSLWYNDGKLYIGTKTEGFYIIKDPESVPSEGKAQRFDWEHYGRIEGLKERHVTGFAAQARPDGKSRVAILHQNSATFWDGKVFSEFYIDGRPNCSCIAGDQSGNIWIGTDGGLFRIWLDWRVSNYSATNAEYESNRITAVAVSAKPTPTGISVWVACDDNKDGSDKPPTVKVEPKTGIKRLIEADDVRHSSLHYFDGLTWDKWMVPGVSCLLSDADYLWMGTNLRLRRFWLP